MSRTILKAKRVLVTIPQGPEADSSKIPFELHRAKSAIQEGLRHWKRYQVTNTAEDADLIMVVRKASGVGVSFGSNRGGLPMPPAVNNPLPATADSLAVFDAHGPGLEGPPLWTASEPGGLNAPEIKLLKKFQKRVEEAEKKP
ncbi:MAG TPA: hypothetical protein VMS96_09395 [Terriglobales bacterium]|nr:hypothetical protein [Terriglobales bacterium]